MKTTRRLFPLLSRGGAGLLLIAAALMLGMQVQVSAGPSQSLGCGSAWDVLAGSVGWQQWWSADLAGPGAGTGGGGSLVRTLNCPAAVNSHLVVSGALVAIAVVVAAAGEFAGRPRGPVGPRSLRGATSRIHVFGSAVAFIGGLLTVGGVVGVALLVADPRSTLFLYVGRPVVLLAGLLLVLPAIFLMALGRGAVLLSEQLRDQGEDVDAAS